MSSASSITRHLRIHGLVQGVYYRHTTIQTAQRLGLQGWVRNRSDGSVEAVFAGPQDAVMQMIEMCHRGPPPANVKSVVVSDTTPDMLRLRAGGETFSQLGTL